LFVRRCRQSAKRVFTPDHPAIQLLKTMDPRVEPGMTTDKESRANC
jgi:hypothetical protein